ncbi:hypothetical protein CDAR_211201 [Caerostris darwini]|uniref:Uncharacterized protein n=1 Tax=Caerostris darwini TaxID=1538125 RepID=A0AAV4TAX9_9ARAC|nr:hypothetical protein CDAR_211201 [Caerostris darwini]
MIGFGSSFLIAVPSGHDINLGELCDKTLVKRLTSPAPQTTPESDSVTLVAEVGKSNPKIQHNSNTGNNLPVSLPPYHVTTFKEELDKFLVNGYQQCSTPPPTLQLDAPTGLSIFPKGQRAHYSAWRGTRIKRASPHGDGGSLKDISGNHHHTQH